MLLLVVLCRCVCYKRCYVVVQYFALVVVIFVMEIIAGVLAFVYRHDIEHFLYKELMTGISKHYPLDNEPDVEGLRATWSFLQTEVRNAILYYIILIFI